MRGSLNRGTGVDPIDLDPVKTKSVLGGPIQKKFGSLGIVDIGRRDQNRQNEAERAGQNMALDALDFLVAVEPTLTLLRAGDDALRIPAPLSGHGPHAPAASAVRRHPPTRRRSETGHTTCVPSDAHRCRSGEIARGSLYAPGRNSRSPPRAYRRSK